MPRYFNPTNQAVPQFGSKPTGFALVIALSLMAFILLLLVALSSMVRIETSSVNQREMLLARTNALLSANIAVGDLIKYASHDQRVTAQAAIFDSAPNSATIEGVNEPFWTGVWTTDPQDLGGVATDARANPSLLKEGQPGQPQGALSYLVSVDGGDPSSHTRSGDDVPLLWVDRGDPDDPRNIRLPESEIRSGGTLTGHFAWWISDEGTKASISLQDELTPSAESSDQQLATITAPRLAPETVEETDPDFDLSVLKDLPVGSGEDVDVLLSRVVAQEHLRLLLGEVSSAPDALYANTFHDLTPNARGVLSNTRFGGLKKDLTAAFSSDAEFSQLLNFHTGGNGGDLVFGGYGNGLIPDGAYAADEDSQPLDPGGPPWAQLRDFFDIGLLGSAATGGFAPQRQSDTEMGAHPVIAHFSIHYHAMLLKNAAGDYFPRMMIIPAVILWNPYNVSLDSEDYLLYLHRDHWDMQYFWRMEVVYDSFNQRTQSGYLASPNYRDPMPFSISSGFGPGEAKLFVPNGVQPWVRPFPNTSRDGNPMVDATGTGWGGYFYYDGSVLMGASDVPASDTIRVRLYSEKQDDLSDRRGPEVGNMFLSLSLTADAPIGPADWSTQIPLQTTSVGHFSPFPRSYLYDLDESEVPFEDTWGTPSIPAIESNTALLDAMGGSTKFPFTGAYTTMRWMDNAHSPPYEVGGTTWDPQFSYLAHFNPRAVRSWPSPLERLREPGADSLNNPIFYSGAENFGEIVGASTSSWNFVKNTAGLDVPVGYSDDVSVSLIEQNTLFDLPRGPEFFQSIASLQHANLSPPEPPANRIPRLVSSDDNFNTTVVYPTYAIGNSMAPLGIPLDSLERHNWPSGGGITFNSQSAFYDWSYLLNDYLYDSYFFSSYDSALDRLYNSRFSAIAPTDTAALQDFDDAASNLMIEGAFNVNSTSVVAWRALLSGLVGTTVELADGTTVSDPDQSPYLKNLEPLSGIANNADLDTGALYSGFRSLDNAEIDSLAEEIVEQVKKRGPFVSLSHFVNRVVQSPAFQSTREGSSLSGREVAVGALQAAIEKSTVNGDLEAEKTGSATEHYNETTADVSRAFGQPGYVSQADLLSRIGPVLTVRSDTFRIRAYGESRDPISGQSTEAWCEIGIQRIPAARSGSTDEREFVIDSFRWLNENEI